MLVGLNSIFDQPFAEESGAQRLRRRQRCPYPDRLLHHPRRHHHHRLFECRKNPPWIPRFPWPFLTVHKEPLGRTSGKSDL